MRHPEPDSRLRRRLSALSGAVLLATTACTPEQVRDESAGETARGASLPDAPVRPSPDTIVAQPIHWEPRLLESTLRAAGYAPVAVPHRDRQTYPDVPVAAFRVAGGEVEAFFFGDQLAAARALRRLTLPDTASTVAFTSNNMVVVARGANEAARQRIRMALTVPEARGTLTP